jgi:hypothetical protein
MPVHRREDVPPMDNVRQAVQLISEIIAVRFLGMEWWSYSDGA